MFMNLLSAFYLDWKQKTSAHDFTPDHGRVVTPKVSAEETA